MKISKFGRIEEIDGRLHFTYFVGDGEHTGMNTNQALLFACIQWLMVEFERECKSETTHVNQETNNHEHIKAVRILSLDND